jgi:glycosyltransferase involved in cell wall biosynthesis
MHVLLIHQAFTSPLEAGGTRHYEFGEYLVENGHRFTIVASDIGYLTGKRTAEFKGLITMQKFAGIRVIRAHTHPSLHRSFKWRVVSFVSFMITSLLGSLRAGPVDVVMGTSPPIFQAITAWWVAVIRNRPFLLEIRDLWPEFAIDIGVLKHPVLIKLSRWLERFLYRRADKIIVNSPAYRDYLLKKGIQEAKISLIPNGVNTDMFDPEARGEELRRKLAVEVRFVVTYAGALGLANDIPTILRAASRLVDQRRIVFLLVGDGKERPHLERMAQSLGLDNVKFIGAVPKNEMPEVLAASDVCIAILRNIPMFKTTYPNKVFDYMAAGRPTILVIDGVIRNVIEKARGGIFVPPGDDATLADAVRQLSGDCESVRAMGISARRYVVEHFDRRSQAKAFEQLIMNTHSQK